MICSEELRKEARQLKRELLAAKQKKVENSAKQAEKRSEGKHGYQAYIFFFFFKLIFSLDIYSLYPS